MQFSQKDFFIEHNQRDYSWSMHKFHYHNSYEIYYMNGGKRTFLLENKYYELNPGDVMLFRPNVPHKTIGTHPHEKFGVEFSKGFLDYHFTGPVQDMLLRCYKKHLIRLDDDEQRQFRELFRRLYGDYTSGTLYALALAQMLVMLNDAEKKHEREVHPPYIFRYPKNVHNILLYIEENYSEIQSVEDIARNAHLDKSYLCRLFKKETDMTLMEYLYNYRIQRACEKLASTKKPIAEIAHSCGFKGASHFIQLFKSMLDCTPGQFRKNSAAQNTEEGL
ncbi:MAG: AraC family transcriptional regulator [bacterium]|nr:AraC family transcriptional regulator [bacterium]